MGLDSSPVVVYGRYQNIKKLLQQELAPSAISERLGIKISTVYQARSVNFQIKTCLHTPYLLTTIELETIKLVALGYSNHAIALLQKSAYRTVDGRLKKVYRKLGIRDKKHICKRITAINLLQDYL